MSDLINIADQINTDVTKRQAWAIEVR